MRGNKFISFLTISLALTAFLTGYIMVNRGLDPDTQSKTGTILDKFEVARETDTQSPDTEELKIFPISSVKAISISNSADRKSTVYFEKNTGKLFEFSFEDKKEQVVSGVMLANFLSSIWSPVKSEVLSLFYSSGGTKVKYHNYTTGLTADLNSNIRSIAFSPDGDLIAYYLANPVNPNEPDSADQAGKIYIAQPDGNYPKKILDTRMSDLEILWPAKDQIILKTSENEIFLLTTGGKMTRFLESAMNLDVKWSVGGQKLLFSFISTDGKSYLMFKDVASGFEKELEVPAIASKCTWSIDGVTIFCAIAKTPSVDDVYEINTDNGSQNLIAEPGFAVKDIFLTALEDYLIITNARDEKLYGVRVSP